jgi:hypothetical protein
MIKMTLGLDFTCDVVRQFEAGSTPGIIKEATPAPAALIKCLRVIFFLLMITFFFA